MKVTVVGAGAVGATCADNIARGALCEELVLLDIKEGLAEGKAQDMMQTAALLGFDTRITGSTNDYSKTAGSQHDGNGRAFGDRSSSFCHYHSGSGVDGPAAGAGFRKFQRRGPYERG